MKILRKSEEKKSDEKNGQESKFRSLLRMKGEVASNMTD